jgi:uncharacterized NAD-dependent epimerase/dehydratase family protein
LGLLHGTQPDVIVLCHAVGRERIHGLEDYPTPSLSEAIETHLQLARLTNPNVRCAGVSLNTSALQESHARTVLAAHSVTFGLPVADPIRGGVELHQLIEACLG